jgi:2-oxoglutarate dehydrogenase E2 component (dihydrolipoamide succinyltransferase)
MKERVEKEHGVKLSFMPFFAKATVLALKAYPVVNAQLDGDAIIYKHYVNLGIAVASEAGLVVPNVKDADQMGLIGFSRAMNAVAKRARDGKLTMDDLTGGTFTITNGGVFGSLSPRRSSTIRRSASSGCTRPRTARWRSMGRW